jgi:hypothetical protein
LDSNLDLAIHERPSEIGSQSGDAAGDGEWLVNEAFPQNYVRIRITRRDSQQVSAGEYRGRSMGERLETDLGCLAVAARKFKK